MPKEGAWLEEVCYHKNRIMNFDKAKRAAWLALNSPGDTEDYVDIFCMPPAGSSHPAIFRFFLDSDASLTLYASAMRFEVTRGTEPKMGPFILAVELFRYVAQDVPLPASFYREAGYKVAKRGYWYDYGANYLMVIRQKDRRYKEVDRDGTGWQFDGEDDEDVMRERAIFLIHDTDISWRE